MKTDFEPWKAVFRPLHPERNVTALLQNLKKANTYLFFDLIICLFAWKKKNAYHCEMKFDIRVRMLGTEGATGRWSGLRMAPARSRVRKKTL